MVSRSSRSAQVVRLVSVDLWSPTIDFLLESFPLVLGSNGQSNLRLETKWIDDMHCEIDQIDGDLWVRDLRSTHGTLINEDPIEYSVLSLGDRLTIGIRTMELMASKSAKPRRRRAPRGASSKSSAQRTAGSPRTKRKKHTVARLN